MDKNLEIIQQEKTIHHGVHRNRLTIDEHLAEEWNSDMGKPVCVYEIKKMIVIMRRTKADKISIEEFTEYLEKYQQIIIPNLNSRWLISICDTLADYCDGERKANATWIAMHFKRTLISDSFLHHYTNWELQRNNVVDKMPIIPQPSDGQKCYADTVKMPDLPGATTVTNLYSDIVPNMSKRVHSVLQHDELLCAIFYKLEEQYKNSDSIYGLWEKLRDEG